MAIQLRRGAYADFDPQKMKPAEVAVVQEDDPTSHDGKAVYVAISPGDVKRMAVLDELQDEVHNQIDTAISTATQAAVATATQAAAKSASEAAASADAAAESARTLTIDSTLTQPGQVADAKVVGDKIEGVKSGIDDTNSLIYQGEYSKSAFVQGVRYTGATTVIRNVNNRCTTPNGFYMHTGDELSIIVPEGFRIAIVTDIGTEVDWQLANYVYKASAQLIAFVNVSKTDNAAINPEDFTVDITFIDNSSRFIDLKNGQNALNTAIGTEAIEGWVNEKYLNTSDTTFNPNSPYHNAEYRYVVVECAPGDVFTINGLGGGIPKLWAFADASNSILARSTSNYSANNLVIVAPENAAKLIINDRASGKKDSYKGETVIAKTNTLHTEVNTLLATMRSANASIPFELGNIRNNAGQSLIYENNNARVRTPEGYTVHMFVGDSVGLSDYTDARYYVSWYRKDGTIGYHNGWLTADYTIIEEGYYVFTLANLTDQAQSSYRDLADLFKIDKTITSTELIGSINENDEKVSHIRKNMWNYMLMPCGPKFLMHRGLSAEAPENTIPSFTLAGQSGAWGIETDLWRLTTGEFVCHHDATVDRMTDGTGNIADMSLSEIQALTINAGNNIENYPNLKIPTLEQFLRVCRRYGCVAMLEIKQVFDFGALVEVVRKCGMLGSTVFLTGSFTVVNRLRKVADNPIFILGFINTDKTTLINNAAEVENVWIDLDLGGLQDNSFIEMSHEKGMPVCVYTIDNSTTAETWINNGADIITSNSITKLT